MSLKTFLAAMRTQVVGWVLAWALWPRAAWCRKQRRLLRTPGGPVVWVRGKALPWATWGASHGYFDIQSMNGLVYLRAAGAPE